MISPAARKHAADHRVSDGHRGALFLRELAELLQHPEELDKEAP
ncbi:MAG: 2-oxo acid dehydrogenase subunit E2 [Rhodocyclaceae bacterium]|jgi:pyruvate dehydrogenase E2 component (dihydrolipoamide acetyltransferase)|nr:2-oxo acid dehydrogenase subunit E2 [Rhodocyclaceae bacterium]MDP3033123.1 2-oxo acid dehydrogenase subunit E2 [Rhodocyclaceae bacterium]